jgi:hypothetical protein
MALKIIKFPDNPIHWDWHSKSEFYIKLITIISVFLLGLVIFNCFQNEKIFKNTLGRIAITYENVSKSDSYKTGTDIIKTNKSFTSLKDENFIHWDVKFFKFMEENSDGTKNTLPGIGTYAFSPLFPFLWKISHLPAKWISLLNYLLFAFSILILSNLFLSQSDFKKSDRLFLFILALTLPSVFSFYIPYCESTYIFTFSIALWGLFKEKFWVFFIGMIAFVLSRPSFLIVGIAFICTDIYFLVINKNFKLFFKELGIKLLPIFIGMILTFCLQYLKSGSFFRMFTVHSQFWQHDFQFPTTITDWSTESYGMNIFSILCIVLPSVIFLFTYLFKYYKGKKLSPVSLFSSENRDQYLFNFSIIFFFGNFLFVIFTQGGNLNGMHRYILVSPFFYIFFFLLIKKLKTIDIKFAFKILSPMVLVGYLLLIHGPYQHSITFLDMGFFLLVLAMVYFLLFNKLKLFGKLSILILIVLCNTVWLTYLFNHFLNNSHIIA